MGTIWPPDLRNSTDSKYIVLVQSLRAAIHAGQLAPGDKLPPIRALAWDLGVTPGTVARAYRIGTEQGLLRAGVGRGTFVAGARPVPAPDAPLISQRPHETIDLAACTVPDRGQADAIGALMQQLGGTGRGNYVDYPTMSSDLSARAAVADWLADGPAGPLSPDDVVLSLGAQHGTMLALQACISGPSPVVLTEELGYPGIRHAARLLRCELIGVEMDQHGIRPDRLAAACRRHGGQVLMTSAEVHGPTTRCTPLARRQEIADIARQFQFQIIEDDCHRVAPASAPGYRALSPERGWYVSSLTKSVSAALRFGFVICPRDMAPFARQVAQSNFYGLPQPMLDLATGVIRSGLGETCRARTVSVIRERVQMAVNILGRWDIAWRESVPFIWLQLPQGWRGSTFVAACLGRKIRVKSADEFALADRPAPHAVRIAMNGNLSPAAFEAALRTIGDILSRPPMQVEG